MPLHVALLPVVLAIAPVLDHQVMSISAVFPIVPVMVVAMVAIIYADLDYGLLRFGFGHNQGGRNNGSRQEE